jgi:rare lipoprotein A (peptidoglycan hydrolase)
VALGIFLILVASATSRGATTGGTQVEPAGQAGGALLEVGQASERRAAVRRMSVRRATWYGPGFYGRPTACGLRLQRSSLGVAHKRLPCGTPVTLYHRGRFLTVPVIDRGPHVRGVSWDLTAATARSLGFRQTGEIRSIP